MKILYFLQITKDKLSTSSFKIIKQLLNHILKITNSQHIIMETYFEPTDFGQDITNHLTDIVGLIVNGYNLLEPEHCQNFPLVKLDILLPQLFGSQSVLIVDDEIRQVYYNEQTNKQRLFDIIDKRPMHFNKLELICPIHTIKEQAMQFECEVSAVFEKPRENPISKLFKYGHACMGGTFDHIHLGHKLLLT